MSNFGLPGAAVGGLYPPQNVIDNNNLSDQIFTYSEGFNIIQGLKSNANPIPASVAPYIFQRLGSINTKMTQAGVSYRIGGYYYYLVENILESEIDCYKVPASDLKEPFVLDLKAFAYTFPNKSLFVYPNQYGISPIIQATYRLADSIAFEKDQKIFEPFAPENYNGDFNQFIDSYTNLTAFINDKSLNEKKLYTLLFFAKPTRNLGLVFI